MRQGGYNVFAILLLAIWLGKPVSAGNVNEQLTPLFEEYIAAWNIGDHRKIATAIYRAPLYIFDRETTTVLSTPEEITDLLASLRRDLDTAGFSYSTLHHVGVCDLGNDLAFATLQFSRIDSNGDYMGQTVLSSSYIARKTPVGWRLVAHVLQGKASAISCE